MVSTIVCVICRSCKECARLRGLGLQNCKSKRDSKEVAAAKDKISKQARKEMFMHMREPNIDHQNYPAEHLFPPTRYTWKDGKYTDQSMDNVQIAPEDLQFVNHLIEYREENVENHYVNMTEMQRRGPQSTNARPPKVMPGHLVVLKGNPDDSYPWYIGEVVEDQNDDKHPGFVTFHEYGSAKTIEKLDKLGKAIDPSKVRWSAIYRGEEYARKRGQRGEQLLTRDQYRNDTTNRHGLSAAMKPLYQRVNIDAVIDWDTKDRMFVPLTGKTNMKGHLLKKWVVQEVSANLRVQWNMRSGPQHLPASIDRILSPPDGQEHIRESSVLQVPQPKKPSQIVCAQCSLLYTSVSGTTTVCSTCRSEVELPKITKFRDKRPGLLAEGAARSSKRRRR